MQPFPVVVNEGEDNEYSGVLIRFSLHAASHLGAPGFLLQTVAIVQDASGWIQQEQLEAIRILEPITHPPGNTDGRQ